jgi:hypothetical protein
MLSKVLTLSRITNGPLTPPMVLYRRRGVTDIIRGSRSGMAASVEGVWVTERNRKTLGVRGQLGVDVNAVVGWSWRWEVELEVPGCRSSPMRQCGQAQAFT